MSEVLRAQANEGRPVVVSSHQLDIVERLCDRVGIINHGQMVATGTVTELTDRGPLRFWVDVPAAAPGWYDGIAGVTLVEQDGSRWLLAARRRPRASRRSCERRSRIGPVHEFRRDRPGLSQLFRDVMSETAARE